jgi:hypothetical protein
MGTKSSVTQPGFATSVGGAGIRIPVGAGTRAPGATPTPGRRLLQIGIGRGVRLSE